MIPDHSLIAKANQLLDEIAEEPELLVGITPPRDSTPQLKKRAEGKVHNGKPNFHRQIADYSAVELVYDLEVAIQWNDLEEVARTYYQLQYLIGR